MFDLAIIRCHGDDGEHFNFVNFAMWLINFPDLRHVSFQNLKRCLVAQGCNWRTDTLSGVFEIGRWAGSSSQFVSQMRMRIRASDGLLDTSCTADMDEFRAAKWLVLNAAILPMPESFDAGASSLNQIVHGLRSCRVAEEQHNSV
ncbi:hypothetical protein N9B90_00030 [bacterium]|nr:hypothetical protein [bacterium]